MLAVSTLRSSTPGERAGDDRPATDDSDDIDFDFDFSEIFAGFDDAEALPGLEIDSSEILADFPAADAAEVEKEREEMVLSSELQEEASTSLASEVNLSGKEGERGRKASAAGKAKGSNGKRKLKVDWTPELHRRFVEAVEQLGVEKAVPSRILELMGINCLTRHNVASHLQKYRSHRKHIMVREAEAASWSQRRQVYGVAARSGPVGPKSEMSPCLAPIMGFPPQPIRPLHVWGHPTMDQSLAHTWPKHLFPIRPAPYPPPWVAPHPPLQPPPPLPHVSPWHPHFGTLTQGTPYFPQPLPALRLPAQPVAGIPQHPMYRPDGALPAPTPPTLPPSKQTDWLLPLDAHPSKESIDAAIGDVLAQPWLSLPLGLKPPSLESVMVELQKQGISKVPP